jgi:hypothetical protein
LATQAFSSYHNVLQATAILFCRPNSHGSEKRSYLHLSFIKLQPRIRRLTEMPESVENLNLLLEESKGRLWQLNV